MPKPLFQMPSDDWINRIVEALQSSAEIDPELLEQIAERSEQLDAVATSLGTWREGLQEQLSQLHARHAELADAVQATDEGAAKLAEPAIPMAAVRVEDLAQQANQLKFDELEKRAKAFRTTLDSTREAIATAQTQIVEVRRQLEGSAQSLAETLKAIKRMLDNLPGDLGAV